LGIYSCEDTVTGETLSILMKQGLHFSMLKVLREPCQCMTFMYLDVSASQLTA
jgi:hypothetical protein